MAGAHLSRLGVGVAFAFQTAAPQQRSPRRRGDRVSVQPAGDARVPG